MPLLEEDESSEIFSRKTPDAKIVDDEEPERWLETMGAEQSEIKRLQNSQVFIVIKVYSIKYISIIFIFEHLSRVNYYLVVNVKSIALKNR